MLTLEVPFELENFMALGTGPFWQSPFVLSRSSPEVVPGEAGFTEGIICGASAIAENM